MTAIRPTDSALRDKIDADGYNTTLNEINLQYTEMDKYIGNLESDIQSIKEFETSLLADQERGYDVGNFFRYFRISKRFFTNRFRFFCTYEKSIY